MTLLLKSMISMKRLLTAKNTCTHRLSAASAQAPDYHVENMLHTKFIQSALFTLCISGQHSHQHVIMAAAATAGAALQGSDEEVLKCCTPHVLFVI